MCFGPPTSQLLEEFCWVTETTVPYLSEEKDFIFVFRLVILVGNNSEEPLANTKQGDYKTYHKIGMTIMWYF